MFSFFKSRPKLKDLIPNNYVDIHSHILPGIDDGASSIQDTDKLLNHMRELGFEQCIGTPHTLSGVWNNSTQTIQDSFHLCQKELSASNQLMIKRAASEYMIDQSFLNRIAHEPLLTLKDQYVLVEMSYQAPPMGLYEILFELQLKGYQPVLAHPERYNFFHQDFKSYEKLFKMQCSFQLNLLSVVGYYGKEVAQMAQKLLDANMITYVGSDAHHQRHLNAFQGDVLLKKTKLLEEAIQNNQFFRV
jgi:tyrosine-protein phosphatase YwqE